MSQAIVQGPKPKVNFPASPDQSDRTELFSPAGGGERVDMVTTPYLPRDFAGARVDKRVAGGHASGGLVARLWLEE